MDDNNGCLNLIGLVAFVIALIIWVNNVDTITIVEKIPPPQDSWNVVYPQFRDDVSAQLLNTQIIAGSVLDETAKLRAENAELQYSVDLLLNNLGIMKKESYEESIRQRDEQRVTTVLSILLGWLLGAFVTKDSMKEIQKRFSQPKKKSAQNSQIHKSNEVNSNTAKNALLGQIQKEALQKNQPDVLIQKLPQVAQNPQGKSCPKCGTKMDIQIATVGEAKGKQFFVCPNYKQCKQVIPVG